MLGESLTKYLINSILRTLEFLHSGVGISHMDLKLENILISSNFDPVICDFGFSDDIKTRIFQIKGT